MQEQPPIIHRTYNLAPLPVFGVEVNGVDLRREVEPETVAAIKNDVAEYRLMVFRGQGVVSAHRQVEISHWFGELDCPFYKHPASAHPEVCMFTITDKYINEPAMFSLEMAHAHLLSLSGVLI